MDQRQHEYIPHNLCLNSETARDGAWQPILSRPSYMQPSELPRLDRTQRATACHSVPQRGVHPSHCWVLGIWMMSCAPRLSPATKATFRCVRSFFTGKEQLGLWPIHDPPNEASIWSILPQSSQVDRCLLSWALSSPTRFLLHLNSSWFRHHVRIAKRCSSETLQGQGRSKNSRTSNVPWSCPVTSNMLKTSKTSNQSFALSDLSHSCDLLLGSAWSAWSAHRTPCSAGMC